MENNCRNCKYYLEHYIKKNSFYKPIGGHCINDELNATRTKNKYALQDNCSYWEQDDRQEQRIKRIKKALIEMSERINDILNILKDDK